METGEEKPLIVVVDDELDFLGVVRRMLSSRYRVECFSSGEDLLARLSSLAPDLVILDLHMPGEGGTVLCRRIRADERFSALPVLFLTGSRADGDFLDAVQSGGDSYLNKPIGQFQLQSRVREALKGASLFAGKN